jgi:MATE family multidrug resistance protein
MASSSTSSPQFIPNRRAEGRRHSILAEFLSESVPLPPSFLATSPIVREILTRDITECSSEDEAEQADVSDTESTPEHVDAKLAFHPNGVAYGCGYSIVPIQGLDKPVSNPHEVEESLHAELSLLRDNAILPPKYPTPRPANVLARLYRHIFSTKLEDHERPIFQEFTLETTPLLLEEAAEAPQTPSPDEITKCFEEAVASHAISTTWQREAKTLIQYSTPLIFTFLMHYSVTIGSVLTVGRLGMVELAAVNCT